MYRLSLGKVLH